MSKVTEDAKRFVRMAREKGLPVGKEQPLVDREKIVVPNCIGFVNKTSTENLPTTPIPESELYSTPNWKIAKEPKIPVVLKRVSPLPSNDDGKLLGLVGILGLSWLSRFSTSTLVGIATFVLLLVASALLMVYAR